MIGLHHSICPDCFLKYKEWLEANNKVGWKHCECQEDSE